MSTASVVKEPKKRSLWLNAWVRLKRNKRAMFGLYFFFFLVIVALIAPLLFPEGYDVQIIDDQYLAPSWEHPFGTDNVGRDILARICYGAKISLQLGLISVAISFVVGGIIGAVSGFYGGWVDNIIMRIMDIVQSIPNILLAIVIAATLGPGMANAMIAVGISGVPGYARIIRGSILTVRDMEYIEAARAITAGDGRIIMKHIIPNVLSPMIVQATMGIAGAILTAANLSFIGLGVQPPAPEWGAMISAGRNFIRDYWWMVTFPGLAIMVTVISFNLLGDGIRDALDPRMSR